MRKAFFTLLILSACGDTDSVDADAAPIAGEYSVEWFTSETLPCNPDAPPQTCSTDVTITGEPDYRTNGTITFRHSGTGNEYAYTIVDGVIEDFDCCYGCEVATARVIKVDGNEVNISSACSPAVAATLTR